MKKANKLIDLYALAALVITISAVTLRTIAHFSDYNEVTKHFNDKTIFTASAYIIAVGVLLISSFFVTMKDKISLAASSNTPATYIPSGMLTVALVFMGFNSLAAIGEFSDPKLAILRYLSIAISLLAFVSAVFFIFNVLNLKRESLYKSILCICVVLFFTFYSAFIYFNKQDHPTNSPVKIIDLMAYLFSSAFFIYETRITLGRALWKPYIVIGLIAASLCAYSSIPSIIIYIARGELLSLSITESVLTFTVFIFTLSRILLTKKLPMMDRCNAATLVSNYTDSRIEQLAKMRMFYAAANAPATNDTDESIEEGSVAEELDDDDINQETINIDEYTIKQIPSDAENEDTSNEEI